MNKIERAKAVLDIFTDEEVSELWVRVVTNDNIGDMLTISTYIDLLENTLREFTE